MYEALLLSTIFKDTGSSDLPLPPSHLESHCEIRRSNHVTNCHSEFPYAGITENQNTYGSFCFALSPLRPPVVGELPEKKKKKLSQPK